MILPRFLLRGIKESLGLEIYSKVEKFKVSYQCKVKNISGRDIDVTVIFPIPPSTASQKVTNLKFFPKDAKIGKEKTFENKFAYWISQLKPHKLNTFNEEFLVQIWPTKTEENKKYEEKDLKDKKIYTRSETHVDFKNHKVKKLAQSIHPRQNDISAKARDLYNFVTKNLNYGHPINGLYSSVESLTSKQTDCGGFASLLTALLRFHRIPARIVSGYLLAPKSSVMHAWVEFMLPNERWIPADPTIENLLKKRGTERSGKFGFVGSDHLILSHGSDIKIDIGDKSITLDILQNPKVTSSNGPRSIKKETRLSAILDS